MLLLLLIETMLMLLVMMRVVNVVWALQVLMMPWMCRLLLVRAIGVVAAILGAV